MRWKYRINLKPTFSDCQNGTAELSDLATLIISECNRLITKHEEFRDELSDIIDASQAFVDGEETDPDTFDDIVLDPLYDWGDDVMCWIEK